MNMIFVFCFGWVGFGILDFGVYPLYCTDDFIELMRFVLIYMILLILVYWDIS